MNNDMNNRDILDEINNGNNEPEMALDDVQRVKTLSPGMLVFKRFIRNKLAITGTIFIVGMFIFSFIGGWLMPYKEDETFTRTEDRSKDYAGITINTEYKFIEAQGAELPVSAQLQFILAANKGESLYIADGENYYIKTEAEELYIINSIKTVANANLLGRDYAYEILDDSLGDDFQIAFSEAIDSEAELFEYNGDEYVVIASKRQMTAGKISTTALATMNLFNYDTPDIENNFEFCFSAEIAINEIENGGNSTQTFIADNVEYEVELNDDWAVITEDGVEYAYVSKYLIQPIYDDVFFSLDLKKTIIDEIQSEAEEFTYTEADGTESTYTLIRQNTVWTMRWIEETTIFDTHAYPSAKHLLGTEEHGMDVLTRLMYGGRVSLIIGFIVVAISTIIGIVLGGISGYFGGAIDNLIMRIVDTFNSIPSLPLLIILGAMMDQERVDPTVRMMYLMIILGLLSWPGVARMVRGQILSLREQEFMIATEATGISVSKRIFKHLVPNVMPQLIVISTLSLGSVILTESVLSFLGLGVKFPFASWGNIIKAVDNIHVMTNYLFEWIPAGFCILITVLGFNFVGDGLRDAFDPKMKR